MQEIKGLMKELYFSILSSALHYIKHCLVLHMVLANKKVETLFEHHKFLLLVHVAVVMIKGNCR